MAIASEVRMAEGRITPELTEKMNCKASLLPHLGCSVFGGVQFGWRGLSCQKGL